LYQVISQNRTPSLFKFANNTATIGWNQPTSFLLGNGESVPFRFTPVIQDYITPIGIEGLFTSSLMATARCLTEPELELDQYLCLFIRDELVSLNTSAIPAPPQISEKLVSENVKLIMAKAHSLFNQNDQEKVRLLGRSI
jgi:transformation/transcription domain-associated protein